jgi:CheY-like chemotaxis protein
VSSLEKHTVVVVDDLAELRQVLRLILEHGGPFKVVGEGRNGAEAVALAADHHPDLLLMDVEMPGGPSGWEALPRIKEAAPETVVVILSGSRADPDAPAGGGLAAAVLEKGLSPDDLNAALVEILGADPTAVRPVDVPPPPGPPDDAGSPPPPASAVDLDAFASVAGHDLAQPLQVAFGYLEMLRADFGAGLDPTAATWLDSAIGSLDRMRGLVQEILGFARAGARPVDVAPVDLDRALAAAVHAAGPAVAERGTRIEHGVLPTVTSHEPHVVDVLAQLVANAVAFTPPGEVPVVRVRADEDGRGGWVVTVEDEGAGVPDALRDTVFEPFVRSSSTSGRGAGLGLATARKLVERLGGRLWLEPVLGGGRGSAFRFSIPAPLT